MTNIKDYIVAVGYNSLEDLEKEVKSYIDEGWEPIGNITIERFHAVEGINYLQPMIKRETNNDK